MMFVGYERETTEVVRATVTIFSVFAQRAGRLP